ncbi:MAG: hypothetical protein Q4P29_07740 [Tissierellia bacterium]|nr:hypothetical protein [Tissierellia bacterium]
MLKKELKTLLNSKVYLFILILPFILTFFMSEGTKNYLLENRQTLNTVETKVEIVPYDGKILDAQTQFAVSELSFILMMSASLLGLNLFEERKLHTWDRIVAKNELLTIKILLHYIFDILMILVSIFLFNIVLNLKFPISSILLFATIPFMSLTFGAAIALIAANRTMVSNIIMLVVMLLGYLGGALSLTSVLANTKFMNILMNFSPLTIVNRLIFRQILELFEPMQLLPWLMVNLIVGTLSIAIIRKQVKYGSIL